MLRLVSTCLCVRVWKGCCRFLVREAHGAGWQPLPPPPPPHSAPSFSPHLSHVKPLTLLYAALSLSCHDVGTDFRVLFTGAEAPVAASVNGFARTSSSIDNDVRRSMVRCPAAHRPSCTNCVAVHVRVCACVRPCVGMVVCGCHAIPEPALSCASPSRRPTPLNLGQDVAYLQSVLKPLSDRIDEMEELEVRGGAECSALGLDGSLVVSFVRPFPFSTTRAPPP